MWRRNRKHLFGHPNCCWSCGFGAALSEKRRPKKDENGLAAIEWLEQVTKDIETEKNNGNGNDAMVGWLELLVETAYKAHELIK